MSGWWVASYFGLWGVVVVMVALQVGTLRELGMLRQGDRSRARRRAEGARGESGPELGSPVPSLDIDSANGYGPIQLRGVERRARTLLMFLTPTCESCQRLVDPLNALTKVEGDGLNAVVILSGQETACHSFLKLFPLHMPVVVDAGHAIALEHGALSSPLGLLYDEKGVLVRKSSVTTDDELVTLVAGSEPTDANPAMAAAS